jgi:hypothetical protein
MKRSTVRLQGLSGRDYRRIRADSTYIFGEDHDVVFIADACDRQLPFEIAVLLEQLDEPWFRPFEIAVLLVENIGTE